MINSVIVVPLFVISLLLLQGVVNLQYWIACNTAISLYHQHTCTNSKMIGLSVCCHCPQKYHHDISRCSEWPVLIELSSTVKKKAIDLCFQLFDKDYKDHKPSVCSRALWLALKVIKWDSMWARRGGRIVMGKQYWYNVEVKIYKMIITFCCLLSELI